MKVTCTCIHHAASVTAAVLIAAFAAACLADAPSAGSNELFQRLDADANGILAGSEVPAEHKRLFERLLRKADIDGNKSLSREEFLAALVPSRPEKQLEEKQRDTYPQADAVRYVLLTMDTRKDSSIEADEVPEPMQPMYEAMLERLDMNKTARWTVTNSFAARGSWGNSRPATWRASGSTSRKS
jgi:hypothetical protein